MKMKILSPLLVVALLLTAALLPLAARMQPRGVSVGAASAGAGGYYALVIGNNAYASLPRLKTAEADARGVATLLKEFYGFETKLLLNATRGQIVSALSSYRRELGPDANLLIYYAGHGFNDKEADKAYWLPVDATRDDTSNWIIADEITTGIRVIPAKHVLVVADSCYSGTLTRGLGEALPPPNGREQFLGRMAAGRSRTLMASGGDEPVADGGGGNHSVFANALLRGLREIDKDKFTAAELFRYHVEEPVAGRANQTPEYNPLRNSGHESGDFIFIRIRTDGKRVEVTVKTPASPSGGPAFDPAAIELSFWESIKNSTDAEDFKAYLESYPSGRFAALARNNLRRLEAANKPAPATNNAPASNSAANTSAARPAGGAAQPRTATNRYGIELVYVPAGSFMMGSEIGSSDEKPVHRVTFSEGFYMGMYEVTQAQWQQVMGSNPSHFKGENRPVEKVSWDDAQTFIRKLNEANDGYTYRLPSEAEWEYACRAGTTGDYAGNLDAMAWYRDNSGSPPHLVGQKQANAFGLYDMHGNVWEWCQDYYQESYADAPSDGSAYLSGKDSRYRVLRGGSWNLDAPFLRSANRHWFVPGARNPFYGFRVVASARAL